MLYYNLRSLSFHWRRNAIVVGVLGVASAMFILLLGALDSFAGLLGGGTQPDNVIIVARGGFGETWPDMSHVDRDVVTRLAALGIAKDAEGSPLVSPEFVYTGMVKHGSRAARVTVRGVGPHAFAVHNGLEGQIKPGSMLLGSHVEALLGPTQEGETISIAGRSWRVGGKFRSRERQSPYDTEIWVPLDELMQARSASAYSTITLKLTSASDVPRFVGAVNTDDGGLKRVRAVPEARTETSLQSTLSAFHAVQLTFSLLLLGAAAAAILSLFSNNVARRRRDIALLRAQGSTPASVIFGFVAEGLALGVIGGLVGVVMALPAMGMGIRTGSGSRLGVVVVKLNLSPATMLQACLVIAFLGMICSLGPAWGAASSTVRDQIRGK